MSEIPNDIRRMTTLRKVDADFVCNVLASNKGILRLAPNWVPRSFLHPGRRLKLNPADLYAFGLSRGGIDERWFGSTTQADNEGRVPDEGLSYVVFGHDRFTLRDAVAVCGEAIIGKTLWDSYGRWPVYSKFFDNMGPIPLHMHQDEHFARLVGQEGKPEGYYFPPQMNATDNNFPYTFFGLSPNTTKHSVREALMNWEKGDNRITDLSAAYRLKPGTGWLVGPGILHAPGSLCTYEPQWGSDVFAMYQNLCEGRGIERELLVKDVPSEKSEDLDHLIEQLDWPSNIDPDFKRNHFLEPVLVSDTSQAGYQDRWVVYGRVKGRLWFSARELSIDPLMSCFITDPGASSAIVVQGQGRINGVTLSSPSMIGFYEMTQDEVFITDGAAKSGLHIENTSSCEPLVILRYFGPEVDTDAPEVGDMRTPSYV